jgi:hypothetical protein
VIHRQWLSRCKRHLATLKWTSDTANPEYCYWMQLWRCLLFVVKLL